MIPGPNIFHGWHPIGTSHDDPYRSSLFLGSCLRNTLHNFRLLPGAGGQPAGLAKMRRWFLRGPSRHLLYGVDGSHFAVYLQVVVQRARVPLRRQGDGCAALHFPPILAAPSVLPPGSTLNFCMLFPKHDTAMKRALVQKKVDGSVRNILCASLGFSPGVH
jgi:hypothetical protein